MKVHENAILALALAAASALAALAHALAHAAASRELVEADTDA